MTKIKGIGLQVMASLGATALACTGDPGTADSGLEGDGDQGSHGPMGSGGMGPGADPDFTGGTARGTGNPAVSLGEYVGDPDVSFTVELNDYVISGYEPRLSAWGAVLTAGDATNCSEETVGSCRLTICPIVSDPPMTSPTFMDAGIVSATMTMAEGIIEASISPDGWGAYPEYGGSFQPDGPRFIGEETGTISAAGGDVPSFSRPVQFPLALLVTNDSEGSPFAKVDVSRATDHVLTWDRGTDGVFLMVGVSKRVEDGASDYELSCWYPSEKGVGLLPAEILQNLPVGSEYGVYTVKRDFQTVADQQVQFRMVGEALDPAKNATVVIRIVD